MWDSEQMKIIKLVQREEFTNELKSLKPKARGEGWLTNITLFIDSKGISQVGGILDQANLYFSHKHPALLPHHHFFTEFLMREEQ